MKKCTAVRRISYLALSILFFCSSALSEDAPAKIDNLPVSSVRSDMRQVYAAFRELHAYMFNRSEFIAKENQAKILGLLQQLATGFAHVGTANQSEPGFTTTLKITTDLISDAKNRFVANNKDYSLWRLRTAADHCVTCHTRYQVKVDFSDSTPGLERLSALQRGEFLMATRQFDQARAEFLKTVLTPLSTELDKTKAMRNWLIIAVRVRANPTEAITELNLILKDAIILESEQAEIKQWISALHSWSAEKPPKLGPLERSEKLIQSALVPGRSRETSSGSVELLRATATLHQYLETGTPTALKQRGHALFLLGLAYSELPLYFINDFSETFLEMCIRESAGSDDAQRAFRLLSSLVTLSYTGSAGTQIPAEVQLKLKELHDMAYAIPSAPSQA